MRNTSEFPERQRPVGVTIFGLGLIVTSVVQMLTLLNFPYYAYLFQALPIPLLIVRYSLSWLLRIIGLISGIGILALKEPCRKMAVGLLWFTILTVYWKHPYDGFKQHTQYLDQVLHNQVVLLNQWVGIEGLTFSSLTGWSVLAICLLEVLLDGAFIYYFTRRRIRERFRLNTGTAA